MTAPNAHHLIIGCGYTGQLLARNLLTANADCLGIVRSQASAQSLLSQSIPYSVIDLDTVVDTSTIVTRACTVYYLAPPPATGHHDSRMQNFLQHCRQSVPRKIVYISTSGVYGDCQGDWVTETHPVSPLSDRAHRRASAEQQLFRFADETDVPIVILRVGGIYGPGRIPIARIDQTTVICPKEAPYSNRIHAADLAMICFLSAQENIRGVFNVSDGNPTSMTDYFYQIADRAGIMRPPCVSLKDAPDLLSPGMLSFVQESRRLDTRKLRSTFNITLRYPTLAAGLDSCADDFTNFHADHSPS